MLAAACFILALAGWGIYYARAAQEMRQSTERLQPKIDKMRAAEAKFAKLRKETAALDSMATPLITAINDRDFCPAILADINARQPKDDIWITELIAMSGGKAIGVDEKRRM